MIKIRIYNLLIKLALVVLIGFVFSNFSNQSFSQTYNSSQSGNTSNVYLGAKIDRVAKQLAELEKEFFRELSSDKSLSSKNVSKSNSDLVIGQQKKIDALEKSLKSLRGYVEEELQILSNNVSDTSEKISSIDLGSVSSGEVSKDVIKKINDNLVNLNEQILKLNSKIDTTIGFIGNAEARIIRIESLLNSGIGPSSNTFSSNNTQGNDLVSNESVSSTPEINGLENSPQVSVDQNVLGKEEGTLGLLEVESDSLNEENQDQNSLKYLPDGTPEEQYKFALDLALKRKFRDAELALNEFMSIYPNSEQLNDAHYWFGGVLFRQEKYEEAAFSDIDFNNKYPDDSRTIDTTLRIAQAMSYVAPADQACTVFENSLNFIVDPPERFVSKINELKADKACD